MSKPTFGDLLPERGIDRSSSMDQVRADDWIAGWLPGEVFAQPRRQSDGHAMTLLLAEPEDR
ncbi:hypothetical protein [Albimonas pacifica]|uniref:hypothetical protein n=1 Tax=Albimonas pacifica TaxID=1114924 RepID=UPI000B86DBB3|nr:hypothetical protein [Albimonas pacifica]